MNYQMKLKICLSIGALFILIFTGYSQQFSHRIFNVNDGLVQQQVTALFKDSRGYLWVGTKDGISRFNGETFTNYTSSDGAPVGMVIIIFEDRNKHIVVCTSNEVSKFDGVEFKEMHEFNDKEFYPSDSFYDQQDRLWLKYRNEHGMVILKDSLRFEIEELCPEMKDTVMRLNGLIGTDSVFFRTHKEEIWIFDGQKCSFYKSDIRGGIDNGGYFDGFRRAHDGKLYIEFGHKGWKQWTGNAFEKQFKVLPPLLIDNEGYEYYIKNGNSSLERINPKISEWEIVLENIEWYGSPLLLDEECIWVGSEKGLIQVFDSGFKEVKDSLLTYVWGIQENSNGNLLFANYGNGLVDYDGENLSKISIVDSRGFPFSFYFHPVKNKEGQLFFPSTWGVIQLEESYEYNLLQRKSSLFTFYDSIDNRIISCEYKGITIFDGNKEPEFISLENGRHGTFTMSTACRDNQNNYWVGSKGGLSKIHIPTKKITYYLPEENRLPISGVICSLFDTENNLWVGGYGGFGLWDFEGDSMIVIGKDVFSTRVENLTQLDENTLIIGGAKGLFLFDKSTYLESGVIRTRNYNQYNGYNGIEPTLNCTFIDSQGNFWVSSSSDLAYISVEDLNFEQSNSKVRINRVGTSPIPFSPKPDSTIFLPYGKNNFRIDFETIGFSRATIGEYSFKLEGHDESFSPWLQNQTALYSGVSSGTYKFVVKSKNPSAIHPNEHPVDNIYIKIKIPFWKSPHFFKFSLFGAFVSFVIIGLAIRGRRNAKMEAREKLNLSTLYKIQTAQAQLHPHFLSNVLGVLQNAVLKGDQKLGLDVIGKLNRFLRQFMESSISSSIDDERISGEISLNEEINLLKDYIDLQKSRQPDKFSYEIRTSENVKRGIEFIPPMIILPFVENAIKHGFFKSEQNHRSLTIEFFKTQEKLTCRILDDGIGRKAAQKLSEESEINIPSRGNQLVEERIKLLQKFDKQIDLKISDLTGGGTVVDISFYY